MWGKFFFGLKLTVKVLSVLFVTLVGSGAWGDETRLSIGGYDPVAYFTDAKPVPGKSEFEYVWHDALWSSAAHRDLFIKDPEHYAPQYDGYCALGVSLAKGAHKDTVDPEAWAIVNGKLYLAHTTRALDRWRENAAANIELADAHWSTVKDQPEPVVVGPPCPDRPPSVVVSLAGGARRVLIGGQVALGEDGKVIGKGDMRAQVEQVGKNIQACLKAAGAGVSDIILTRAYVTDANAFSTTADLRTRYLGPESKTSSTALVPKIAAGPDFLVEIEAVATLN
jgi:enamine deaminase RidA (YjgF/YER057c/UK114 family)